MRARLLVILLSLMTTALVALGVPLARSMAQGQQQSMFFDRLRDTSRFAGLASQYTGDDTTTTLADELERYDQVYGIEAVFYNRDGKVLAQSRTPLLTDASQVHTELAAALRGREGGNSSQIWPWQQRPLVIAVPVLSGGDVIGATITVSPTDRLRGDVARRWLVLALGELAALLLCVVVALWLTRWLIAPVHSLDAVTHAIATGALSTRVSDRVGPPELRRLASAFNEMADQLQDVISQQRAFVADASHQLRNPLSALLLRIENIGLGLPPEWLDELEETRAEGRRLTEVLDELLALAQAEHGAARPVRFDVVASVRDRLAAWRLVAASRQITLVQRGLSEAMGYADPTAVGSALDAVIDNAIKFSPPESTVKVTVAREPDAVRVVVLDQGPGVAPEELSAIGRRFWRSPRNVNVGGSGLGLSIARALLGASGGDLAVALAKPTGLEVTIRVPRQPAAVSVEGAPPAKVPAI